MRRACANVYPNLPFPSVRADADCAAWRGRVPGYVTHSIILNLNCILIHFCDAAATPRAISLRFGRRRTENSVASVQGDVSPRLDQPTGGVRGHWQVRNRTLYRELPDSMRAAIQRARTRSQVVYDGP